MIVSPTRVSATSLIEPVKKPTSPGPSCADVAHLGREDADAVDRVASVRAHHPDGHALLQHAVDDAHQHDDAEIGVVPAIDQQRLQRRALVALRRRQAVDDRLEHRRRCSRPVLAEIGTASRGVDADHFLDLLLDAVGLGGRQVDLVEDRHDLVVGVDAPGRRWRASAPRRPATRRRPAASPRRRQASASTS